MELSLQRKVNAKKVFHRRKEMINRENLHIDEDISYEQFSKLYEKYGKDMDEKDFARYFFDLYYEEHYNLQSGKIKQTKILSSEFVSEQEILAIKNKAIDYYGLKPNDEISYEQFVQMYNKFGGRLSIYLFAEKILNVTKHTIETAKSKEKLKIDENCKIKILKPENFDKQLLKEIQLQVVKESGRHIKDQITLEEFQDLYHRFGKGIDEKTFAVQVLQVERTQINCLLRSKTKKVTIFSRFWVNPDDICQLREKVILEEKLHIWDPICKTDFERLYQKYGGILTEEMFAEEVLDVTLVGVRNMKKGADSNILTNIEIPERYIEQVRQKIIAENAFEQKHLLEREKIQKLYQEYGYVLSEKQFITLILDTIDTRNQRITILRNQKTTDFDELRKRVIAENHLHYDDRMEYFRFKELHTKYAPNVREYIFAKEVLDIPQNGYENIKFKKGENFTHILLEEKLPDEEEIQKIKETVIKENKLHRKDEINYEKLKEYHLKYGGIMPEDMFAERILDVKKVSLNKIRPKSENQESENQEQDKKHKRTKILLKTEMKEDEIQELKRKIVNEKNLYNGKEISKQDFEEMYYAYEHILAESEFAKEILGVNYQSLNKLKNGDYKKVIILIDDEERKRLSRQEILYKEIKILVDSQQTVNQIQKKIDLPNEEIKEIINKIKAEKREQEKKIKQEEKTKAQLFHGLEMESKRILKGFDYEEKNVARIREYLDTCQEFFENGKLDKEKLDFLGECIEFVQGGTKYIEFFSKMCISFREYEKARVFISNNIDNKGIKNDDKVKLKELQAKIMHAIKREKTVHMVYEMGIQDVQQIVEKTGLSEIEVLRVRNQKNLKKNPDSYAEYYQE